MTYWNQSIPQITNDQRIEIYEGIWNKPIKEVAKKYGISDTTLRKRCGLYGIPLPYAGYWAKKNYGKDVKVTPLPPVDNYSKHYVTNYHLKFISGLNRYNYDALQALKPLGVLSDSSRSLLTQQLQKLGVLVNPDTYHEYIKKQIQEDMNKKLKIEALSKLSKTFYKRREAIEKKYPTDRNLQLPVYCSKDKVARAYSFLTNLFTVIEYFEGIVYHFVPFGQDNSYAHLSLMDTYFDFKVSEEKNNLVFKIKQTDEGSFSNYRWGEIEYKDEGNSTINQKFNSIIMQIFEIACTDIICGYKKKIEEEWERQDRIRQRNLEQIRNGENKLIKDFCLLYSDWTKAQKLSKFKDEVMHSAPESMKESKQFQRYIKKIESLICWLDPLTENHDEALGQSKSIYQMIQHVNLDDINKDN